ncbi:MAG: CpsD/CapB family tyrosine-protein kinase [Terriglobales bacterium]
MSYIFEALQRAEAERSGETLPKNADSVADLLQGVEQEIARKQSLSELPPSELPSMVPSESPKSNPFAAAKVLTPALRADSRLVCLSDQGGLAAEKFRVLGLKLRHLRELRKLRRIVITSSIPEEGKSLIAANLALNQSRSKILSTVLIDGDLRRPELGSRFGFSRSLPGLSEVLRGERELSEVVYKIEGSGLYFIPAGVIPENPIELMQSGRLTQLLQQLGAFFDWIVIDTPPVRPLADTPLWMKLADGVLLVTREGVCEKKQLERAVEVIDRATMLGVVVNSCSGNEQKYYYSRYGSAAGNTEESPSPAAKN